MTTEDLQACHAALSGGVGGELRRTQQSLKIALLTIDKLKVELAYLRRMKYGRSSEQLEHAQLDLVGGMVATPATDPASNVTSIEAGRKKRTAKPRPGLREFPEHLPRRTVVHAPPSGHDGGGCDCQACGRALREIGQDVSEVLDYEPGSFHVVRHVRPRLACSGCKTITQSAAPSRPVERGMAGPGLLAHVLVGKYADSLPLYRQCQIYAREGVMLERSTLTDWVGQVARLLAPLAQAIGRHVLLADKIHGDDTPIRVLGGKGSKAKTGRLWVYVRDDRPHQDSKAAGQAPPAVWFQYSPGRHGEHPARHLKDWHGILQADAFSGYNQLYAGGRIVEAACWSHGRRKLWDIHERQHKLPGTLAHQGLEHIAKIFKIEAEIRGRSVLRRRRVRQVRTRPILKALQAWMSETLTQVSAKSPLAQAIGYAVSNWTALVRFAGDGRIEAENNAAERALRAVAIGRKDFLHLGSDSGGNSAAVIYPPIGTANLNGINPQHYLSYVLELIADQKINRIDELLPWVVAERIAPDTQQVQTAHELPLAA